MTDVTVAELAALVGGEVVGAADRAIRAVGDLRSAGPSQIGFLRDPKYRAAAAATAAGAIVTAERIDSAASQIVVADVGVAFAKIAQRLHPAPRAAVHRVHPSAVVDPAAELVEPVDIGPMVVVGKAKIGRGSVLMAGAKVGDGCLVGDDCVLFPNVVLYPGVRLGDRVCVHGNSVLGGDGFGYAREGDRWIKVPQLGSLVVEDDVEIGAGCAIDRGAMGNTRIGAGTKIDNLSHIAHNCNVGRDVAIAAGAMIAGSVAIGDRVTIAGHVAVGGHIQIGPDIRIGGASGVMQSVEEPGDYMGYPLMEKRRFLRHLLALRDLLELREQVQALQQRTDDAVDDAVDRANGAGPGH